MDTDENDFFEIAGEYAFQDNRNFIDPDAEAT
jgi:hypothetical protein